MASDLKPRTQNPPGVPLPHPTYSQVCITPLLPGISLITLAGLTGIDSTLPLSSQPSTIAEQAEIAYQKIKICLASTGATPRDIVQVKHYIVKETGDPEVDKTDVVYRGWGEKWMEFMDQDAEGHRPPDTVIGVACLATTGTFYECEVWGVLRT